MSRPRWLGFTCAIVLCAACNKPMPETSTAAEAGVGDGIVVAHSSVPSASTPSAPASSIVAPSQAPEAAPPTERHAERKAAAEINHSNYKAELSKLAREIEAP